MQLLAKQTSDARLGTTNSREIMALPHRTHTRWPAPKPVKPDYTNQLDLFSEASIGSNATVVATENLDAQKPFGEGDPDSLANPPPGTGQGADSHENTEAESSGGRGTGGGSPARVPLDSENGIRGGVGPDDAGIVADIEPEPQPSRDFRITDANRIGQGSLREKARDNVAAIRTLKRLEADNHDATEEEKRVLARYVGWGAMSGAFDWHPSGDWKQTASELKELLTPEEYESARASTPNAHFTSPMVISSIWQAMQRLGIPKASQILEPSMGVGHFLGLMPEKLIPGSHRTGVELDSITARIAKKLYPDTTIFAKGFEETPLPDNYFDAVVGNVPFGDYAVHDPSYKRPLTRAIHDYFFAKSLDKLRPGGVMALITSRYTMDKQDDTIRSYLAEHADLLGAIRLPNTAFKGNAGTEVTTDILFLRKRAPGADPSGHSWRKLQTIDSEEGAIEVNEYFAHHPEMMLGKMKLDGTMYRGAEPTLDGELTPELLKRAVAALPEGAFVPKDKGRAPPPKIIESEDLNGVKDGAFSERDGQLFIRSGTTLEPANISAASADRVRGMMAVRDAVRYVFKTQLDDAPEHEIVEARKLLNRMYDAFVYRHGPISSRDNLRAFAGDPDQPLLLSLENYDPETKRAHKTAIFEKRTLERYRPASHVDTAAKLLRSL
jgi:adenine-specific DNA methylase